MSLSSLFEDIFRITIKLSTIKTRDTKLSKGQFAHTSPYQLPIDTGKKPYRV